jgi:hypothetical protein
MSTGQMERVYFDRADGVLITSSRAGFNGTTYPLAGIVAVSSAKLPAERGTAYVTAALGVCSIAIGAMVDGGPMIGIGALLLVAGVLWAARIKDRFAVRITTAAGTFDGAVVGDSGLAAEISLALKTALIERK